MNDILFPIKGTRYKSLSAIRFIYEEDIVKNIEHNKKVIKEYQDKIHKEFKIKYKEEKYEHNAMGKTNYAIVYISRVLKKLDYDFVRSLKYKKPTYNVVRMTP